MNPTKNDSRPSQAIPHPIAGRVLFAEDDEQFRISLSRRLKRAGFECEEAATGAEALSLAGTRQFDVLLADINMPGNQNLELIDDMAAIAPALPVVLLTGRPSVETAARSVSLKVVAYLVKPPDFEELCAVLAASARNHHEVRVLMDSRTRLQDWEKEVARLQRLMQDSSEANRRMAMKSYLRLNLRNLVVGLVEMENLLLVEEKGGEGARALEQMELIAALRKTIHVLEKTRDHFKSKELAELRKELESLLSTNGTTQAPSSLPAGSGQP